jgi:hypothetical protein
MYPANSRDEVVSRTPLEVCPGGALSTNSKKLESLPGSSKEGCVYLIHCQLPKLPGRAQFFAGLWHAGPRKNMDAHFAGPFWAYALRPETLDISVYGIYVR